MSARFAEATELARYESLASGAVPAKSVEELRTALAIGRSVWTKSQSDVAEARRVQTTNDLDARKRALMAKARSVAIPSERQLHVKAQLQSDLAACGAQAAAAYNAATTAGGGGGHNPSITSLSQKRSFQQRVDLATAADESLTDPVKFDAATEADAGAASTGAASASATSEHALAQVAGLVSFGESEQAKILLAGRESCDAIKAAANQSTEELAFVLSQSSTLLHERLATSQEQTLVAMDARMSAFEQRVQAATGQAIAMLESRLTDAFASVDAAACAAGKAAASARAAASTATDAAATAASDAASAATHLVVAAAPAAPTAPVVPSPAAAATAACAATEDAVAAEDAVAGTMPADAAGVETECPYALEPQEPAPDEEAVPDEEIASDDEADGDEAPPTTATDSACGVAGEGVEDAAVPATPVAPETTPAAVETAAAPTEDAVGVPNNATEAAATKKPLTRFGKLFA